MFKSHYSTNLILTAKFIKAKASGEGSTSLRQLADEPTDNLYFLKNVIKARREIATAENSPVLLFEPVACFLNCLSSVNITKLVGNHI